VAARLPPETLPKVGAAGGGSKLEDKTTALSPFGPRPWTIYELLEDIPKGVPKYSQ
jgi:hypothetical protein